MTKFEGAAMIVVDVQRAIDAPYHAADGPRNDPQAEAFRHRVYLRTLVIRSLSKTLESRNLSFSGPNRMDNLLRLRS